jgi:5-oxoprolinase (ATP-hydrolysing)
MNGSARWCIGFDIGGTFADFVLVDGASGSTHLHKCLTTPDDPSRGAVEGLLAITAEAGIALADVGELVHGTTLVTNAIIERSGARVALITTRGFRDVLQMGTEQRYDIYDLFLKFPEPLVARPDRLEAKERIDASGRIVTPLDETEIKALARKVRARGVEAVAVMFMNAFANPEHELRAAAIVAGEAPGLPISISSQVCGEIREYPRAVTTCANAYVQPLMARYLERLEQELRMLGFRGSLRLMHSAGGLVSPEAARSFPIRLLESGPAGGGLATALFGEAAGHKDVISFDMGGTTAKVCLIEIGAGGGSIAALDDVGLLKVGPHSAGADPGPACYGRGGREPTVTDANLLLGYYDPGFFLGGRMALDVKAAERAVGDVAKTLGLGRVDKPDPAPDCRELDEAKKARREFVVSSFHAA